MSEPHDVLLNPLLRLRTTPIREGVRGGSKNVNKITPELYAFRQNNLIERLTALRDDEQTERASHAGRVLIWAGMDGDSQASTHTPTTCSPTASGPRSGRRGGAVT